MDNLKDNVLKDALEYIITVRYEGQYTNEDYLKYWALLDSNVMHISTASFRRGIHNFNEAMKTNERARELTSYHFRLMTMLINNTAVLEASEELFRVIIHNLRNEIDTDIVFDLLADPLTPHPLSGFGQILLLMHTYQDRIDCAFVNLQQSVNKGKSKR